MDQLTEHAIAYLRKDGRASYSTIAKELGTTRSNVSSRLSPLFDSGSLRVIAAIHPRVMGVEMQAHLSLRITGDPHSIIEHLRSLKSAVYLSEATGTYQIIVELHTRSLKKLQQIIAEVRSLPGVLEGHLLQYSHVYSSFFLGEEPQLRGFTMDETNLALAQQLQIDGRKSYAELAEHAGLSISATRDRVTRMLHSGAMQIGVVRGRNSTGSELVFGLGFTLLHPYNNIVDLLRSHPRLEFLSTTIGRYDLVATISLGSVTELSALLSDVRALPEVRTVESWLHTHIHMERYVHTGG